MYTVLVVFFRKKQKKDWWIFWCSLLTGYPDYCKKQQDINREDNGKRPDERAEPERDGESQNDRPDPVFSMRWDDP